TVQSIALVPCPERAIRRPCEPAGLTELARTIAAPPETSRSSPDLPACSLARRRWRPHEDGDLRYARIEQDQRVAPEQEVVGGPVVPDHGSPRQTRKLGGCLKLVVRGDAIVGRGVRAAACREEPDQICERH